MADSVTLSPMAKQQRIIDAVQNYGKHLFGFIRSRVKSNEDAEDILQDVWYQLSSMVDIEPIEQLSSWLFRVSHNRIVDKQRKLRPGSLEDLAYEDEEGEFVYPEALLADVTNPEIELERAFLKEEFFKALEDMPQKQREVYVWNELEGMTLQEIANKTGEKIKTIISRKVYAVVYLRARLREIYNEY